MSIQTADVGDIYQRSDGKLFIVVSRCDEPTVTLKEVTNTENTLRGGISGCMWNNFEKLVPQSRIRNNP